jgi:glucose/arabinose dehydrogenase
MGTSPIDLFDVTDPSPQSANHNGGYLKFGPDGKLYVEVGEFANSQSSQDLSTYAGKILRMNPDGSAPSDNPFPGSLVYAYGIRNAFGMEFDPNTHILIETEAGPSTDEINIIKAGGNYGWPTCAGVCSNPAYEDPIMTFNPATTPTGIAYASSGTFYFGEWNTGALKRLQLSPEGKVLSVDQAYASGNPGAGIIAVERGPDGSIYFSTTTSIFRYRPPAQQTATTTTEAIQEFESSQAITILTMALLLMLAAWLLLRHRLWRSGVRRESRRSVTSVCRVGL